MTAHPYDKHYFHGGGKVGGYAGEGYRDFPVHWNTYRQIMKRLPTSVLELGCGRGYVLKRLRDFGGISARGLEISEHCYLTRAIDTVTTCDVTEVEWPVPDRSVDLCTSVAFLEHIAEDALPHVFAEMRRTCDRGLHGIDVHDGDGFDQTHVTIRPIEWWRERLPPGHEAIDKEELEAGPLVLPADIGDGVKLNLGCFTHMFHGWRNVDKLPIGAWAKANGYRFAWWDLTRGIPYDDGIVDRIFLSHVLEHFDYDQGAALLAECRRALRPGGVIRIAVPDAGKLIHAYHAYEAGTIRAFGEICGSSIDGRTDAQILHELLYSGDHRAIYDAHTLASVLTNVGFERRWASKFGESTDPVMRRETIDLYPDMSLFFEAVA